MAQVADVANGRSTPMNEDKKIERLKRLLLVNLVTSNMFGVFFQWEG